MFSLNMEGLKLLAVLILLIVLLFRRVNLALTVALGAFILGILFDVGVSGFWEAFKLTAGSMVVWRIISIVILVLFLNGLLRDTGALQRMVHRLSDIIGDKRAVIFFPPMIVGFLPMPAGALFTASLTDKIGEDLTIPSGLRHFINYWFRHVWEFSLPVYPSVILEASLLGVSLISVASHQWFFVFIAMILGVLFSWFRFPKPDVREKLSLTPIKLLKLAKTIWPILLVLFGFLIFKINIVILLLIAVFGEILFERLSLSKVKEIFNSSVELNLPLAVFVIYYFQSMLKVSNAVYVVPNMLKGADVPLLFSLFFFPFLISFMTGMTTAGVAISFSVLAPLMGNPVDLKLAAWTFVSGYSGHLLSPFHLCLITTKEYYKVTWLRVYKEIFPAVAAILAIALVITLI